MLVDFSIIIITFFFVDINLIVVGWIVAADSRSVQEIFNVELHLNFVKKTLEER